MATGAPFEGNIPSTANEGNPGDDLLEDLDSYLEDINDRLTISRMVNDSIIKGIVTAVSQEATQSVTSKDLEILRLKAELHRSSLRGPPSDADHADISIFQAVESMVLSTIFNSIQEQYNNHLLDVNTVLELVDRLKELSTIKAELDSIHKSLGSTEHGHLGLHVSHEIDVLHRKMSLSDGNNNCEESKISMPENLETSKLNHMNKDELYQYFRTEITKMKRDHESTVQNMTDKFFALKREYLKEKELLKEKGPFAGFRKDKDFEVLRKNISDVIQRLNYVLTGGEKLSEFCDRTRAVLGGLLSENRRLKAEASDATRKLSERFVVEEELHGVIDRLKGCLDEADVESSVREEVYRGILNELAIRIKESNDDLDVGSLIVQDVIRVNYDEAVRDREEFSEANSLILQQIYEALFEEAARNMSTEHSEQLSRRSMIKDEDFHMVESKALRLEDDLKTVTEENKKLNDRVSELENSIRAREKSLDEVKAELEVKKQEFEGLVCVRNEMVDRIGLYKAEVTKLNEDLGLSEAKCRKIEEEVKESVSELDQKHLDMIKIKDREYTKSMEGIIVLVQELSSSLGSLELRTKENISWLNVRLENSSFQLKSVIPKVNILRRKGQLFKETLEKKCSDLQKAETEVDLLGDEVDALLGVLEKVYVALDHYSPILQHYPGIMEILKLVRRELSGDGLKTAGAAAALLKSCHS